MMYKSISTLSEFLYKTKTIMAFAFPVAVVSVACPRSKGSLDAICLSGDPRFLGVKDGTGMYNVPRA